MHHYYKCVSVKKTRTECHKRPVRKEWIEDLVVGETMKMVMDDKAIEAIVSMLMDLQDRDNVNVPLYEQQLREAETAISNLLNAIQQGILTRSTKERLEELENRRDELESRLACEKLAKPKVSAEFMTFWLHRFRKLDVRQQSHRKMLIDTFINAIFLYDDKMVITFNYKEGTKTITLAELQEAISNKNGSDLDCLAAPRKSRTRSCSAFSFRCERGLEKGGGALRRKQSPSGVLLSLRFPTRRNIYREDCRKNRKSEPFLDRRRVRIFCFRVEYIPWRAARVTPSGWLPAALGIALRFSSYRVGHLWRSALPPTHKWTPPQRPYRSCKWTGSCCRCFP